MKRFLLVTLVTALAGCTPGYSINTISQTSTAIVLEYTHSVGGEFQATIQDAEKRCQQYGKHARLSSNVVVNVDRAVATFDCLPP